MCNHPDLFELRPTVSPFVLEGIEMNTASLVQYPLLYDPFKHVNLSSLNLGLADLELNMTAFQAHRTNQLKVPKKLIEEIDSYNPEENICSREARQSSTTPGTSSCFSSLTNLSQCGVNPTVESESRSFLDVLSPSDTSGGSRTTISDILLKHIEDYQDGGEIDVESIDENDDLLLIPMKKPKVETKEIDSTVRMLKDYFVEETSPFYLASLKLKHDVQRKEYLNCMACANERHCSASPVYGRDLCAAVTKLAQCRDRFVGALYHQKPTVCWCSVLQDVVKCPQRRLKELQSVTDR